MVSVIFMGELYVFIWDYLHVLTFDIIQPSGSFYRLPSDTLKETMLWWYITMLKFIFQ